MKTVFPAYAQADWEFATKLAEFLEFGCNVRCFLEDGLIGDGQDIIAKAEEGLSADVLLLLLSPGSSPEPWPRERWEPVLVEEAARGDVQVVTLLLEECSFPRLLRRRNFIDGTASPLTARRLLKRWLWQQERGPGNLPGIEVSGDLEDLYQLLADRAGSLTIGGDDASRFAKEAADEFEAVLWVPCQGLTLAQASGELGAQLGIALDGTAEENCRRIRDLLVARRCLVVLDAPAPGIRAALTAGGRTSTAITRETVKIPRAPQTLADARTLIAARRYAEAYELLYGLLDAVVHPDECARELTWICEHWGRVEEANALRFNYGPPGGEQLHLF